jgi:hypothetical protein
LEPEPADLVGLTLKEGQLTLEPVGNWFRTELTSSAFIYMNIFLLNIHILCIF